MSLNFYKISEDFLINLAENIEDFDKNSVFDVDCSDGILDILIHETEEEYVINRHNANQKIWYSSPLSGADYFAFDDKQKKWLNDNKQELSEKLFSELKTFLNN